ncbi:MAG: hypothetical protein GY847_32145 [Proteobacteria bacterium]|nr:hypothetical protein [Pseudomonadota bacterium]
MTVSLSAERSMARDFPKETRFEVLSALLEPSNQQEDSYDGRVAQAFSGFPSHPETTAKSRDGEVSLRSGANPRLPDTTGRCHHFGSGHATLAVPGKRSLGSYRGYAVHYAWQLVRRCWLTVSVNSRCCWVLRNLEGRTIIISTSIKCWTPTISFGEITFRTDQLHSHEDAALARHKAAGLLCSRITQGVK